jgi:hypothetical protein
MTVCPCLRPLEGQKTMRPAHLACEGDSIPVLRVHGPVDCSAYDMISYHMRLYGIEHRLYGGVGLQTMAWSPCHLPDVLHITTPVHACQRDTLPRRWPAESRLRPLVR